MNENKFMKFIKKVGNNIKNFFKNIPNNAKEIFKNLPSNTKKFFKELPKKQGFKTFTALALAVGAGLLVGLLVLIINDPSRAFQGFSSILIGPFGDPVSPMTGIGEMFYFATPIMLTGLSVGFAFKTGMFNIGAAGQFVVGQFAAIMVGFYGDFFGPFQWVFAVLAGIAAGGLWGFFVGFFKSFFNVNEVITAIMFNYIGLYLVNFLVKSNTTIYDISKTRTIPIPVGARLPDFGLSAIFPRSSVDFGFILAILVAVVLYVIINKTIFGYEITAVGHNRNAAKYGGINEKKSIILSMVIAGALAGLGGALYILSPGFNNLGKDYAPVNVLPAQGFNGIPVALLGLNNPIAIIFSALFITYLQRGGNYTQAIVPIEIIDIIVSIIIYFSAFAILAREVIARVMKRRKERKEELASASLSGTNSGPILTEDTATNNSPDIDRNGEV